MTTPATPATPRFDPLRAVLRHWWLPLLAMVLGSATLATVYSQRQPVYTSETVLRYDPGELTSAIAGNTGLGSSDVGRGLATQAQVVLGDSVVARVATSSRVDPVDLRDMTSVEISDSENSIVIAVTAETPTRAAGLTRALADAAITDSQSRGADLLEVQTGGLTTAIDGLRAQLAILPVESPERSALADEFASLVVQQERLRAAGAVYPGQLTVLRGAEVPEDPSSPGPAQGAAVGAALGLVLGLVGALALAASEPRRRPSSARGPGRTRARSSRR